MDITKDKLKLLRFWARRKFKPYVQIKAKVKHLNKDEYNCKEKIKIFDDVLKCIPKELKLNDILTSNLPDNDLIDFIKIHYPELKKKLDNI